MAFLSGRCPTRWQCAHTTRPPAQLDITGSQLALLPTLLCEGRHAVYSPAAQHQQALPHRLEEIQKKRKKIAFFGVGSHVSSGGNEVWIHGRNKRQLTHSLQRQMENWTEKLSHLSPQQVFTSPDGRRPAPSPGDGDAIAPPGSDILHYRSLWILLCLSKSSLQ